MEEKAEQVLRSEAGSAISTVLGEFWWVAFVAFIFLLLKGTLDSLVDGFIFRWSNDYAETDEVMIDGHPARIVKLGVWSVSFYVYVVQGGQITSGWERSIQMSELKHHSIMKPLGLLDLKRFGIADTVKDQK
tara:strand:- start:113 stop:508 length:396 start_codon:yes stop_codon:yes gene_type:complete